MDQDGPVSMLTLIAISATQQVIKSLTFLDIFNKNYDGILHRHVSPVDKPNTCSKAGLLRKACLKQPLKGRVRLGVFSCLQSATLLPHATKSYTDLKVQLGKYNSFHFSQIVCFF